MSACLLPPPLGPEQRVALLSPSGPIAQEALDAGSKALQEQGLDVDFSGLGGELSEYQYLAQSDARRLQALMTALQDSDLGALLSVRGGYGAMRLLAPLTAACAKAPPSPKRYVGFSDATALHAFLHFRLGWASISGPMPLNMATWPQMAADVAQALRQSAPIEQRFEGLGCERPGRATGRLFGGNLSLIEALYRSPFLPSLEGVVLMLEDVGERLYRLDRLLTALALRGAAQELRGIVLGSFSQVPDADERAASAHVAALLQPWGLPMVSGMPFGHTAQNRCIWLGSHAELDADAGALRLTLG
ncbi:MAG: LD-carboxypeptidase [Myxococcota bacterium]|nr:LD-carboxypeptidase [Myxococcota bacterium]